MEKNLTYELQQMGLEKNEAVIYMASLELGPSPVQRIAQRGKVPRATTYLILEELKKKGLVATHEHGKKTYFTAQHPSQLEGLLKKQENELEIRKKTIETLIPELEQRGQFAESKRPRVRYYEGKESFGSFRRDLLSKRKDQKLVRGIVDHDKISAFVGNYSEFVKKRTDEGVASRSIYVSTVATFPENDPANKKESRKINGTKYPFPADVSIIGNCVGLMPYGEPFRAVIIEDKDVADALSSIFELAWKGAEAEKGK
jgi:sugar-specific transcriptional regulator TrmB